LNALEHRLKFDLFFKDDTWQIIAEAKQVLKSGLKKQETSGKTCTEVKEEEKKLYSTREQYKVH